MNVASRCRDSQRLVNRPSMLDSTGNRLVGEARFPGPLRNGEPLAAELQITVQPRIVGLLMNSRPTAVSRLVASCHVDSIQGQAVVGPLAHVGSEGLKRVEPPCADRHATGPVKLVERMAGVRASLLHIDPGFIDRGSAPSVGRPVDLLPLRGRLARVATARSRRALSQMMRRHDALCATVAAASPHLAAMFVDVRQGKNFKAAEASAGQIHNLWHRQKSTISGQKVQAQ